MGSGLLRDAVGKGAAPAPNVENGFVCLNAPGEEIMVANVLMLGVAPPP
jgi:hypothetical protein